MGKYEKKRTRRRRPSEEEELESAYTSIAGSRRRKNKQSSNNHTVAIVAVVIAVAAICLCIAAGYIYFQKAELNGIILDNVTVAGVDVGGMTQANAIEAVRIATANTYSKVPMVVTVLESQAEIPVSYVGALDIRNAVKAAYQFGNTGSASKRQQEQQIAATTGYAVDLTPYLEVNEEAIRKILAQVGGNYSTTLTQTKCSVTGQSPKQTLVIQLGIPEYGLDLNALYKQVMAAYSANTFTVEGYCGMIEPDPVDLDALYQQYYKAPVDAYYDPEKSDVVAGIDGYGFDLEAAKETLSKAEYGTTVEIPLGPIPPAISREDVSATLFQDVLGTFTASANSNKNRNVNLRLACEAIDGLVLNPGDVFSYNDTLGERTEEKGYKAADAYAGGKTVSTVGGGICQVSSSLYYSVLEAELQVVTRRNHGFVSSYMPMGLDATVSWDSIDFQFKNNLNFPIRIEASASGGKTTVSILGTETRDYRVKLEYEILSKTGYTTVYETMPADNPEGYKDGDVISTPYTGYEVDSYRIKYALDSDEELSRELIAHSVYKKRDKVICKIEAPSTPTEPSSPTDPAEPTEPSTPPETPAGDAVADNPDA